MAVQLLRHRFTVDEYHKMGQVGILGEDDRLELLEGEIVEMAPIGSRHQAAVNRLNELFSSRVTDRAIVSVQGPVRLDGDSEPQPDIALLRRREDFYQAGHPGPGDVRLAHKPDEYVPIAELEIAVRTLALTALRFCGHEGIEN